MLLSSRSTDAQICKHPLLLAACQSALSGAGNALMTAEQSQHQQGRWNDRHSLWTCSESPVIEAWKFMDPMEMDVRTKRSCERKRAYTCSAGGGC